MRGVAKDEQATRFRAGVERSVRTPDCDRQDVPVGQLHALPSPSAVAAAERPRAPRADIVRSPSAATQATGPLSTG